MSAYTTAISRRAPAALLAMSKPLPDASMRGASYTFRSCRVWTMAWFLLVQLLV
jgi:hypothetical protein